MIEKMSLCRSVLSIYDGCELSAPENMTPWNRCEEIKWAVNRELFNHKLQLIFDKLHICIVFIGLYNNTNNTNTTTTNNNNNPTMMPSNVIYFSLTPNKCVSIPTPICMTFLWNKHTCMHIYIHAYIHV